MKQRDMGGVRRPAQVTASIPELPAQSAAEPVMRRWPHPVAQPPAIPQEALSAALCRLDCALTAQTRLLEEICSLLRQLTSGGGQT